MRVYAPAEQESSRSHPILMLGVPTPLGRVHIAATPRAIVRIELPQLRAEMRMSVWLALHFPLAPKRNGVNPILKKAAQELEAYFTGDVAEFTTPLELWGTSFQTDVWKVVAKVSPGTTRTYAEIAASIGRPFLARIGRCKPEMTPVVSVRSRPNGLPIARTF